jgi:hypothetical protein
MLQNVLGSLREAGGPAGELGKGILDGAGKGLDGTIKGIGEGLGGLTGDKKKP